MKSTLAALLLAASSALAHADDLLTQIDPAPRSEWWIDSGFATWHFQRDKDLNGSNTGLAAEYRFSSVMAATAGRFYNSDRAWSNYAGLVWQPLAIGAVRVGAAMAAFDGYPHTRDGGWFPALIPTLTWEYKRVGVNVAIVPTYKDRLYGGISVQLKFKLFE
jgi:hypothetical protein